MKDDYMIQYSFRLNLKNPDHLLVHQTLMNLNSEIYGSKSKYMIDCILKVIKGDIGSNSGNEVSTAWFVTRDDIDGLKTEIETKLKNELSEYFMRLFFETLSNKSGRGLNNTDRDKKEDL